MSVSRFTLAQLALVMGLATSAVAQYGPGSAGSDSNSGRPTGGPSRIEGPATPAVMQDTIGVTGEPLDRYAAMYANHIAATGPLRDSLRSSIEEMRAAFQTGGRDAARKTRSDLQRLWKDLSKRDEQFEKGLNDLLSKDQQQRYKKWKEAREKAEKEVMAERRRQAGQRRR